MCSKLRLILACGSVIAVSLGGLNVVAGAPPSPQGSVTAKEFLDIGGGTTVPDLTGNAKFPDSPDLVNYPGWFEWPTGPDINTSPAADVRNNYGVQIIGYFYPPSSGDYIFYLAADDGAQLFLSTDATAANKKSIAIEPSWNPVRDFLGTARRNATNPENNSQTYLATQWDTKDPFWGGAKITLQANQPYYIEALMKEGGGGDNLAVAVQDPNFVINSILPIPGEYLSTIDKTTGPVSITTQPQNQTVDEGRLVSFSVVADGTPPFTYQWKRNGTDIQGETGRTLTITNAPFTDNGARFSVAVTGGQGSITSSEATLTVNQDTTPPTAVKALGGSDFMTATVTFSERIDAASATFTIAGLTVTSATQVNDTTVVLKTSRQQGDQQYTITINGVRDRASTPNTIAANSTVTFNSPIFKTGIANWERWNDVGGDTANIDTFVANLIDPNFRVANVFGSQGYLGHPRGAGDNYGAKCYAWFVPPQNGDYVFILAADDQAYMYLSTDEDPANKVKIAAQPSWSDQNQWDDPDTDDNRSDLYPATEWPNFNTITLQANQRYYIELDFREGGGGDGGEVYYKLASAADPANGTAPNTTGNVIGVFVDPCALPPVITTPPQKGNFASGGTINLTVVVSEGCEPPTYQWYLNKAIIPGATSSTLTIANAGVDDIGDYDVAVSNSNGTTRAFGGAGDDAARWIMNDPFIIEIEDYNHTGGQTVAAASTAGYTGGAYLGLAPTLDVDFNNDGDESGGAAFDYNRHTSADTGVLELKGGTNVAGDPENSGDAVANPLGRNRGMRNNANYEVTVNYAAGWTDAGDWQNYTRTFAAGSYNVVLAAAHDGLAANEINQILYLVNNPAIPDNSTPNTAPPGGAQGITEVGRFLGPGTGAWSSNDFYPLRDTSGNLVALDLDGTKTLRLMFNAADGDSDFLLFYPAGTTGGVGSVRIARDGANITISEDPAGGSTVQMAPSILGPWSNLGAAPQTRPLNSAVVEFFRLTQP